MLLHELREPFEAGQQDVPAEANLDLSSLCDTLDVGHWRVCERKLLEIAIKLTLVKHDVELEEEGLRASILVLESQLEFILTDKPV